MAIAQLSIDLVAKVASFERDLKRMADTSVSQSSRMTQAFSLVGGGLAGLAAGLSVGAVGAFVKSSIDAVDALNDVADATGASIENISALQELARLTGTEMDTVTSALVKFNGVLKDADPAKGPGAILTALGLSLDRLKQQDPAEAMRQVAVALQGIGNTGDRARAIQELFGKSVKESAAFLTDLASVGGLVATVTTQQTAEAEKFNKQLFKLQAYADSAARTIASALVPALNRIFDDVASLGNKATLAGLASDVTGAAKELQSLQNIKATAVFAPADIDQQIQAVTAKLTAAKAKFNAAAPSPRDLLRRLDRDIPFKDVTLPTPDAAGSNGKPKPGASTADPLAQAKRYLESLQQQLQATQDLNVSEKLLADLQAGRLGKATPAIEAELKATAKQIDTLAELARIDAVLADNDTKALARAAEKQARAEAQLQSLISASPSALLQKQRDDVLALTGAFESGRISEELYLEAVTARLDLTGEKIEKSQTAAEKMQYVFTNAFKGMEDALAGFVQTGKLDFSSLANSIIADMARIAIQQSITAPLTAAFSSSLGSLGSLFGFANGAAISSPSLSAYSGGVYNSPHLFKFARGAGVFGEAGPEAIMPLKRAANGQLGVQASGGGGGGVVVNVIESPNQGGTQQRRNEGGVTIIDIMVDKVRSAIAGDITQGRGAVPNAMASTYGLNRVAGSY